MTGLLDTADKQNSEGGDADAAEDAKFHYHPAPETTTFSLLGGALSGRVSLPDSNHTEAA